MERWAILIDMEGFSALWSQEKQILLSLGELMRAIFRVGRECFPDSPERLFVYQIGDGFLVVSEFEEESLERAITIAVVLMQHVASTGRLAKAVIVEGELSDIKGCYPQEVMNELSYDHSVTLQSGRMNIFPVMGTALIRAAKIDKTSPSGPLLIIEKSKYKRIPSHIPIHEVEGTELLSINWVIMVTDLLSQIQRQAGLTAQGADELLNLLNNYCVEHPLSDNWIKGVKTYLGANCVQQCSTTVGIIS